MAKSPTLAQVAALAKVSVASASMILSESGISRFSEETVSAVQQAAKVLGYQRRRGHSGAKLVHIICPSVMNPYYAVLIQGMQQIAHTHGYDTALYTTYWDMALEKRVISTIEPTKTAGVIFAMIPQQPQLAEVLGQTVPVVTVGDRNSNMRFDTVDVNNYHAGELVAKHLIALGHRRVAYLSTTLDGTHTARLRRLEGVRDTFRSTYGEDCVAVVSTVVSALQELNATDIEHEVGYRLTEKCLRELPQVTAMIAINDMVAYGVLDALADKGLRVPQDYSVCGFDNIFPSRFARIGLTTVEHSIEERGQSAFYLLLEKLQAPDGLHRPGTVTRIEYQSQLIIRQTTAIPRNG
ncbi:MAG: LacI family DNA-binding transcriptional regulator [Clostridia bacterium]